MNCSTCSDNLLVDPTNHETYCPTCVVVVASPSSGQSTNEPVELQGGSETGFTCPTCENSPLQVADMFGTQVCFCEKCRGFIIDRQSLGELVEILRAAYDGEDDQPTPINVRELDTFTRCPACFQRMETFPYYGPGNVVLDTCEACTLTWFNEGELMKIIRAPGKRDYGGKPYDAEALRSQLYRQAEIDGPTGIFLLGVF